MLIEFTVGNYRSFKEPQTLSLVAAPKKAKDQALNDNNVVRREGQPDLLTSAAIYGANASGKSNLIKALGFMRTFVRNSSQETRQTGGIGVEPFRLHARNKAQPSYFQVVFVHNDVRYRYGFEVTEKRVVAEWLYSATRARESRLFERDDDATIIGRAFAEGRGLSSKTRPNALFLSVVAQFNGPTAQSILRWFTEVGVGTRQANEGMMAYTTHQLENTIRAEAIRGLVCSLDLGINNLKLEKIPVDEVEYPDDMPEELVTIFNTLLDKSDRLATAVLTAHTVYDDNAQPAGEVLFGLDDHESEGTRKLFALAGPLLDAFDEGSLLVVDELDARLHPRMTREIVRLFNDRETNPKGAQLIFTTQDTNLLDNELFRRDQIWFVEKNRYGASQLYSLAEFKGVRNDLSFERGYIEGRFGAIPYLNPNKLRALLVEGDGEEA